MSLQQRISKDFYNDGRSTSHHQTFGQEAAASAVQHCPLVIKILGLLNFLLLTAAVVMGIYCASGNYPQVPQSAIAPLLAEMIFYRNHSHIIQARLEAEKTAANQRASGVQVKLEVKQQKAVTDNIMKQIGLLQAKKRNLQSNTSALVESCNKCLPGWVFLKYSCYYFSSQNKSEPRRNWFESRESCVSQGGDLLVIDSAEEQLIISDNYPKQSWSVTWWHTGSWMGLTDNKTSGAWVWVNNATAETFYWRLGQPKTEGPQSGSCAAFHFYGDTRKTWYNSNCQEHQFNWICETKPK